MTPDSHKANPRCGHKKGAIADPAFILRQSKIVETVVAHLSRSRVMGIIIEGAYTSDSNGPTRVTWVP